MLKLDHVQKRYGDFSLECSLEVQPGRVTGLIGQNGAGKSTAFKAALGLIRPENGEITLLGKPMSTFKPTDREQLGVALAESGFSGYLRIRDVLPILRAMYPAFDEGWFLRQAERFHLPLDKQIKAFSTGMKARLKVLTALSHGAKLLILDEPTAGLDAIARDEILDLLRTWMQEDESRAILISSHISGDLESLCDDLYMIEDGRVILHEDTDVLLGSYATLKMDEKQYAALDKRYVLRMKREPWGVRCLTNQKQFYLENHPEVTAERGSIDDVITLLIRGEAV